MSDQQEQRSRGYSINYKLSSLAMHRRMTTNYGTIVLNEFCEQSDKTCCCKKAANL